MRTLAASPAPARTTGLQVFTASTVGAIERSRDTLDDESYVAALEILHRWLSRELARARKPARRLRVVA